MNLCLSSYQTMSFRRVVARCFHPKYERINGLYVKESKELKMGGKYKSHHQTSFLPYSLWGNAHGRHPFSFLLSMKQYFFTLSANFTEKLKIKKEPIKCFLFCLSPVRSFFLCIYHLKDIFFIMRNCCLFLIDPTSNVYKSTDENSPLSPC